MERSIFVPSINNTNTGERKALAIPAGFFCLRSTGTKCIYKPATCTCRSLAVMALVSRPKMVLIDSGKGKSLFVCPNVNQHHHVQYHRNQFPGLLLPAETSLRTAIDRHSSSLHNQGTAPNALIPVTKSMFHHLRLRGA